MKQSVIKYGTKKIKINVITKEHRSDNGSPPSKNEYNKKILTIKKWKKIYVGVDNTEELVHNKYKPRNIKYGTTIIIQLDNNHYLFVCDKIILFNLAENDEIIKYYSPYFGSSYPRPYIIGKINVYIMLNMCYYDKKYINFTDPISLSYLLQNGKCDKIKHKILNDASKCTGL